MEYDLEQGRLHIDVSELCELACAAGDLDARKKRSELSCNCGTEKIIRSRSGEGAALHCRLEMIRPFHGFDLHICGTADIIHPSDTSSEQTALHEAEVLITVAPSMLAEPPLPAHFARAKILALMYCAQNKLSRIGCRVTYVAAGGSKTNSFYGAYHVDDLDFFLASLLERISARLCDERDRVLTRRTSVKALKFPYSELRPGQSELISSIYRAAKNGKRLFAQAPTGIGKTVSAIYGAVRALGDGYGRRIFYLTAKAATRREAFRAAAELAGSGLLYRTLVLASREQCCINPAAAACGGGNLCCTPRSCVYARGYYDKRDKAIFSLLEKYHGISQSAILAAAREFSICPYELSLDIAELCDMIICDYNYVFDPSVKLKRFFSEEGNGDRDRDRSAILLIDEAHNLPERARDICSAELSSDRLESFSRHLPLLGEKISSAVRKLDAAIDEARSYCSDNIRKNDDGSEFGYYVGRETPPSVGEHIKALGGACEAFLHTSGSPVDTEERYEAISACARMARICRKWATASEAYDDRYRTYIDISNGRILIRQYCLDPSAALNAAMNACRSAIFFSATLTPSDYFSEILGGGKRAVSLSIPSPFPEEQLLIATVSSVSTRYEDRERSARRISSVIAATASARKGNYIVYFPSYAYLDAVFRHFTRKYPNVKVTKQSPRMSPAERDAFISFFADDSNILRIGFCVLGGSFSEGVDLPGNKLIGVVIVGVGLPGLSFERNLIRDYYQNKNDDGYNYAYTYPGMNKVLQAAGRVIRKSDDRGVVVLIDDRYATPQYRALFPAHWKNTKNVNDIAELPDILKRFWSK